MGGDRSKNIKFLEFQKVEISKIHIFQGCSLIFFFFFSSIFLRNTGSEGQLRVQKIENFRSSQNHPKSIGIYQESIISHSGIIKTLKTELKHKEKHVNIQKSHDFVAVFWALSDPVFGSDF